jgi:hypothetical protein
MTAIGELGGVNLCVAANSQPLGATCNHETTGNLACDSGICAPADIMGLLEIGVCSECFTAMDCPANTQCLPPQLPFDQPPIPGTCQ